MKWVNYPDLGLPLEEDNPQDAQPHIVVAGNHVVAEYQGRRQAEWYVYGRSRVQRQKTTYLILRKE